LEGIILPSAWDDQQRITAVSLYTIQEKEFRLKDLPIEAAIAEYGREYVAVTGIVCTCDSKPCLAVKKVKRLRYQRAHIAPAGPL